MKINLILTLFLNFSVLSHSQRQVNEINNTCMEIVKKSIDSVLVNIDVVRPGDQRPFILFNIMIDSNYNIKSLNIIHFEQIQYNQTELEAILLKLNYSCLFREPQYLQTFPKGFQISYRHGLVND